MANQTIYGCVKSNGAVEFTQSTCKYTGCVEWSGAHAGMVKITIPGFCNDTYYACVDWSNRRFQVSIPDNCCCPCSYNNNLPECYGTNKTPTNMGFLISGVTKCDNTLLAIDGKPLCAVRSGNGYTYEDNEVFVYYQPIVDFWCYLCSNPCSGFEIRLKESMTASCFCDWKTVNCKTGFANRFTSCSLYLDCCTSHYSSCYGGNAGIFNICNGCIGEIWITAHAYIVDEVVKIQGSDEICYQCILAHTSSSSNKPGSGANWQTYWVTV